MTDSFQIGKNDLKRVEHTSLDGKKTVLYTSQNINGFEIRASREGLNIGGLVITKHKELEVFAKLVSKMWLEAEKLKPQIAVEPSATPDPVV